MGTPVPPRCQAISTPAWGPEDRSRRHAPHTAAHTPRRLRLGWHTESPPRLPGMDGRPRSPLGAAPRSPARRQPPGGEISLFPPEPPAQPPPLQPPSQERRPERSHNAGRGGGASGRERGEGNAPLPPPGQGSGARWGQHATPQMWGAHSPFNRLVHSCGHFDTGWISLCLPELPGEAENFPPFLSFLSLFFSFFFFLFFFFTSHIRIYCTILFILQQPAGRGGQSQASSFEPRCTMGNVVLGIYRSLPPLSFFLH